MTHPVNQRLGEVAIEIGDRNWTLRPTFQALAHIEAAAGANIPMIAARIVNGGITGELAVAILHAGLAAAHGDQAPSPEALGELLMAEGIGGKERQMTEFLTCLLTFYGASSKKKAVSRSPKPTRSANI
jgi:hypothetical protein